MKNLFLIILMLFPLFSFAQYSMSQEEIEVNLYLQEASNDISQSGTYFMLGSLSYVASVVLLNSDIKDNNKYAIGAASLGTVFTIIGSYKIKIGGSKMRLAYKRLNFIQGG